MLHRFPGHEYIIYFGPKNGKIETITYNVHFTDSILARLARFTADYFCRTAIPISFCKLVNAVNSTFRGRLKVVEGCGEKEKKIKIFTRGFGRGLSEFGSGTYKSVITLNVGLWRAPLTTVITSREMCHVQVHERVSA